MCKQQLIEYKMYNIISKIIIYLYFQDTRICIPVPLYHCFGMVVGSMMTVTHGSTCVFPGPGFDSTLTLEAVSKEKYVCV